MSANPTPTHLEYLPPIQPFPPVYYPESDGQPMAESAPQYYCITDTRFALENQFESDEKVYVGADLLVYYRQGDPSKSVAPDVLIALNAGKGYRRSFRVWEEGGPPDVVFEFASPGTWQDDIGWKRWLYLGIGVREYFLFDPLGEFFQPLLQGYRLTPDAFAALTALPAGERGVIGLFSQLLGLELWVQEQDAAEMPYVLRLYDPVKERWLQTPKQAAAAQREAEAEVARLRAELAKLKSE